MNVSMTANIASTALQMMSEELLLHRMKYVHLRWNFTGEIMDKEDAHNKNLLHNEVGIFIINDKNEILLQKRSTNKKMWPNTWDITAGGHVLAGEFGFQSILRECEEELGIKLNKNDITFIGAGISTNIKGNIVNNHFNEYYVANKEIDETKLKLQEEEVSAIRWIDKEKIIKQIKNNYEGITDKEGCWEYLIKYYKWKENNK